MNATILLFKSQRLFKKIVLNKLFFIKLSFDLKNRESAPPFSITKVLILVSAFKVMGIVGDYFGVLNLLF